MKTTQSIYSSFCRQYEFTEQEAAKFLSGRVNRTVVYDMLATTAAALGPSGLQELEAILGEYDYSLPPRGVLGRWHKL